MKIRKARKDDLKELRRLILLCINKDFGNYPDKKIKAMKEYSSRARLENYLRKWGVFVLVEKEKTVGTISLEGNKVAFSLFGINNSIKKELIDFAETRCAKNKTKKMIAIVMPENRKDFLSCGFKISKRIVLSFGDVKFNELEMEKIVK